MSARLLVTSAAPRAQALSLLILKNRCPSPPALVWNTCPPVRGADLAEWVAPALHERGQFLPLEHTELLMGPASAQDEDEGRCNFHLH